MKRILLLLSVLLAMAGIASATESQLSSIRAALDRKAKKEFATTRGKMWNITKSTGPQGGKRFTASSPLGSGGLLTVMYASGTYSVKNGKTTVRIKDLGIAH